MSEPLSMKRLFSLGCATLNPICPSLRACFWNAAYGERISLCFEHHAFTDYHNSKNVTNAKHMPFISCGMQYDEFVEK
ncbi:MAG: hypothetical protein FWF20_11655 [Betaproteobacteria bacterium]|nr:hypothetical protein [Betaproteobacteria bacterium]MCL2887406.1 hypothetical protein [Betaproteobacteria bacterium]